MRFAPILALVASLPVTAALAAEPRPPLPSSPTLACPAERARYRGIGATEIVADLQRAGPGTSAASDLLMRLSLPAPHGDMWFRFEASVGYTRIVILPVEAPTAATAEDGIEDIEIEADLVPQLEVLPIGGDLAIRQDAPRSGAPAPRYLLLPGLGRALHYGLLPQQARAGQDLRGFPTVFWELSVCREAQ